MYKMDNEPLSNNPERGDNNYGAAEGASPDAVRRDDSSTFLQRTLTAMGITCHVLLVGFTIYILYLSFKTYSLFSWHPACLTTGMFFLMSEAMMAMSPENVLTRRMGRQAKVRIHWILQALAAVLIFAGFLVIVINKNQNNRSHFTSNHGLTGLISIICFGVTSVGGLAALYSTTFRNFVKPVIVKLMHSVFGMATTIIGMISLVLGVYTGWFKRESNEAAQIICTIVVVVATILTLQRATITAFGKIKRMITGS